MQTLTYTIGKDRRALVKDIQNFTIDFNDQGVKNWVQARQYERSMRQVFVNVNNDDDNPFNLTGCNVWLEGVLPDKTHKILDAKHAVILDAQNGQFRFDMPAQAFAVAGSYVQAFFRIVRDGQSITTLEFDLEILADKVISGLIPSDYITPFEDLYDQLEQIVNNADGKLQDKLTEWNQKLQNLFDTLNKMGTDTQTLLQTLQNRISELEEKIKQDGLFTQAEADAFEKSINESVQEAVNGLSQAKKDLTNQFDMLRKSTVQKKLAYKMVSVTTSPKFPAVTDTQLDHLKTIGATLALVDMVNITDAKDSNPQLSDGQAMQALIQEAGNKGIAISMLKPHLGIDYSDAFDRGNYVPSDMTAFFDSWKSILMHYAQIAVDNNIPILCIGCEQFHTTDPSLLGYWKDIIETIRGKYPKLLLTYAFSWWELFFAYNYQMSQYLDFIGMNCYPRLLPGNYSDDTTADELALSWGCDTNGDHFLEKIDNLASKYHKPVLVTEVGVVSMAGGLSQITPSEYDPSVDDSSDKNRNFTIASLTMQAFFDTACLDKNVVGFAWWHLHAPFNFFTESASADNQSVAEKTFETYVKGGLI